MSSDRKVESGYLAGLFSLAGKRAVVTGGAGILPGVMAEALAGAGASVCIWGRGTGHPVDAAVREIAKRVGAEDRLIGETVDTADEAAVEAALDRTTARMGLPDILVNGVGGNFGKSDFVDIDTETFVKVLEINLLAGLVVPTKAFARRWIADGIAGTIINVASMTSFKALSGVWAYNAAKSAVLNLTEGTAREFGPHRIRVNAIAPGFFVGHQNRALLIREGTEDELTPRGTAIIDHTPFGRFGDAAEIAGATVFLASDAAAGFVTGATIPVDGGYLTHNI
jgi:NAD(P)-dependent dehydrogenase (short-subunit alcohol dehydrogenase family)